MTEYRITLRGYTLLMGYIGASFESNCIPEFEAAIGCLMYSHDVILMWSR